MTDLSKYSRQFFDLLTKEEMEINLRSLQELLRNRFKASSDFNATLTTTLNELNQLGHKLYSLDYDSDIYRFREVWGTNYHDSGALGLEIEFESPDNINVEWIDTINKK